MKKLLNLDRAKGIAIWRVSIDLIVNLRHRILRVGLPAETAQFPGDNDPSTWHVGLFYSFPFDEEAPLVSCASFMVQAYKEKPAWQLRGMCTEHQYQSRGFGGRLLVCAETAVVETSEVRLFWCNARVPAVPFYERHGWTVDSDAFDIATAGPHRKMFKMV